MPRLGRKSAARVADIFMLAPPVVLVLTFVVVPVGLAVYLSFTDWNGFDDANFVGWKNYLRITTDAQVHRAALYTGLIALVGTAGLNVFGLATALLLNRNTRLNRFMRFLTFSPYVLGAVVLGFLWSALLGTRGAINTLLKANGLDTIPFLSQAGYAKASVIFVIIWASYGFHSVLYLAGLQTIDQSLIEAAVVDGASTWRIFWNVKLPVLAPVVTLNLTLAMIGMIKVYEWVLTLTGGGPAGRTETVAYEILSVAFDSSRLGYGSAQAVALMVILIVLTLVITGARRKSEEDVAG
jgi:ABC-type sugar transport system permease subunit